MKTVTEEHKWLAELGAKISFGEPTIDDKNALIEYLFQVGKLDREYYDQYKAGKYTDRILSMALTFGAVLLMTHYFEDVYEVDKATMTAVLLETHPFVKKAS